MNYREAIQMAEEEIDKHRSGAGLKVIDEVALCFVSEEELVAFVEDARNLGGLEHFNSVPSDTMRRQDHPGQTFDVRFEFMRKPTQDWRIEAMCILGGEAPLHELALRTSGSPVVVHLSYKLKNLAEYQDEVRGMLDAGVRMRAEYSNSYGMFSYWGPADAEHPYLKPRVNLRDIPVQGRLF